MFYKIVERFRGIVPLAGIFLESESEKVRKKSTFLLSLLSVLNAHRQSNKITVIVNENAFELFKSFIYNLFAKKPVLQYSSL